MDLKEFVGPRGRVRITYEKDRMDNRKEGDLIELKLDDHGKIRKNRSQIRPAVLRA